MALTQILDQSSFNIPPIFHSCQVIHTKLFFTCFKEHCLSTYRYFTVVAYLQDSSGTHSRKHQCDATAVMVICSYFLIFCFVTVTKCKHQLGDFLYFWWCLKTISFCKSRAISLLCDGIIAPFHPTASLHLY